MFRLEKDHVLRLFGKVVYFTLFCVGILFIYNGDIVQRFKTGKTNFAQYSENMTEMPTLVTGLLYNPHDSIIGRDFNISTTLYDYPEDDLSFGQSRVKGNSIKVNIESLLFSINDPIFKITPLSFTHRENLEYHITYKFANISQVADSQILLTYSTENNTYPCHDIFFDGEVKVLSLPITKLN